MCAQGGIERMHEVTDRGPKRCRRCRTGAAALAFSIDRSAAISIVRFVVVKIKPVAAAERVVGVAAAEAGRFLDGALALGPDAKTGQMTGSCG